MNTSFDKLLGEDYGPYVEARKQSKSVPFPQANSLDKVLALVNMLTVAGAVDGDLIAAGLVNNERQAKYYANASIYLGLVRKDGDRYYPTRSCDVLRGMPSIARRHKLAALVLANPVISQLYAEIFLFDTPEERKSYIISSVDLGPVVLSPATIDRRCDCIYSWLVWVNKNLPSL